MRSSGPAAAAALALCCLVAASAVSADHGDTYYIYCLSRQAWHRQEYSEALRLMQQAAQADPGSADLALELSRLHEDLGQHEEAARAALHATELAPTLVGAWRALADALFSQAMREGADPEMTQKAAEAYEKVVQMTPTDPEAWLNQARLQVARGELEGSLASLQRHLELRPTSDEGVYLASQVMTRLGRHAEARTLLEAALKRGSDNPQLALALEEVCEATGDLEAAWAVARRLSGLRIDPVRVQFVMARLSQRAGRHEDVLAHLREMSRLMEARPLDYSDGDRADVRLRIVQSLLDAGRLQEAVTEAEDGGKRFATDPRFPLKKAESLLVAGEEAAAESLLKKELKSSGSSRSGRTGVAQQISDTYLSAGARKEREGKFDRAESLLRKSIEWNEANAAALNYLGYMLADRGAHLEEAVGLIRRALEREPTNGAYLDSLGWAFYKLRRFEESLKALEEAVAAMPDEAAIHDHLGDLYRATGRTQDAIRAWREALGRGAENADQIRGKLSAEGATP